MMKEMVLRPIAYKTQDSKQAVLGQSDSGWHGTDHQNEYTGNVLRS